MNPKSIVKLLQKNLCLQNSYLCTTQSKYTSQRHSSSWKSLTHRVGALEIEVGRLDPLETKEYAPSKEGAPISSVLAVHASGCSYKTWGKLAPLLPCPLLAPNLFGYGRSQPWPPHQEPDIADYVAILTATNATTPVHLIGHSMGGGIALAAAATCPNLKLSSLAVFEPNLFCLLAAGSSEDEKMWGVALEFFEGMLDCATREAWDEWGRLFHAFWFDGKGGWNNLDEGAKEKLVGSTVPHTVYEIKAIMSTMDRGRDYAKELLESLRSIEGGKRIVLGNAECLARQPSLALAHLLQRKAGFQVVQAPVGGHMGPLTHPSQVLPLLLP